MWVTTSLMNILQNGPTAGLWSKNFSQIEFRNTDGLCRCALLPAG
jgi:hypothetical protein